ncbi:FG-GAP-like repeat-containing protein [Micromonospora polyrhachis]|uniref:M23ase beta-sheet core domain-containing protein n=1 Tax=Micromonospora polyrhachis TaxID=1282883 RepID=A0A7W7WSD4_9ACTN|nr:FG-GAP-like repeat-containing protein [Micromonospora polyrhachis]MBB4961532.1 hypothetical protein [Micromonospora polyrhachis]
MRIHLLRKVALGAAMILASTSLVGVVTASPAQAARPGFQAPFPCGETWGGNTRSGHGWAIDFNYGAGADDRGKPVLAAASGTVTGSGVYNDGVSYVIVDHGAGWSTRYLHMEVSSLAPTGTRVNMGDQVGRVSDVGSPGSYHLHFEERLDGVRQPAVFNGVSFTYVDLPARSYITSENCGRATTRHDLSGDGTPDVLAVRADHQLMHYPGGNGWLDSTKARSLGAGWDAMGLITTTDLNSDGHTDVIARKDADGSLWLYPGNGTGWLDSTRAYPLGSGGWNDMDRISGVGDFNGDGTNDLLARRTNGTLWFYPGTGAGWLDSTKARSLGAGWDAMSFVIGVGDLNGDGHVDVAARKDADGTLMFYPGSSSGWLDSTKAYSLGGGWNGFTELVGIGDLTRDGNDDILARNTDGTLWCYPGTGAGWLNSSKAYPLGPGWNDYRLAP